ncbi:MAG TPA: hypothetical protein VFC03_13535 [Acidimicrobiales bacterium]|nr:hypothetical protein [Acidimicrobiales bacterium]
MSTTSFPAAALGLLDGALDATRDERIGQWAFGNAVRWLTCHNEERQGTHRAISTPGI